MATIKQLLEEWREDCKIDESSLDKEIFKTPILHSKYLGYFIEFKAKLASAEVSYANMASVRKNYYKGALTKSELDKYGWDQYQGLKMSNTEFNQQKDIDPVLIPLAEHREIMKSAVQSVEYIMKCLQTRDYSIKSSIEYIKYINGN